MSIFNKIFRGTVANDNTGDPLREGGQIVNDNFDIAEANINRIDQDVLNRVSRVDSVQNIAGLVGDYDGQQVSLLGWHPDTDIGGGVFYWDSTKAKSDHNGGTVFSPTVPWSATVGDYLDGTGEADPSGNGCWVRKSSKVSIENFGAKNVSDFSGFDSVDCFYAALTVSNKVHIELSKPYSVSRKITYPRNAIEIIGNKSAAFSSNTVIQPLDSTFPDDCVIDLNEKGSESGLEGGQFNKLKNVLVRGGMADWKNQSDPLVGLVGVKFKNTRETCGLVDVSFRECGIPFQGEGYIHWLKNIYIYQCYQGPSLISTNSSAIDTYVIQTCAKNWGHIEGCNVHNATIQQGNEKQALDDDVGMTCAGNVNFTGYLYTEGGNAQIKALQDSVVRVDNWEMGFAQKLAGGYGSHNALMESGSSLIVTGGKSAGVKSFLVGGDMSLVNELHLDIDPYDGRIYSSVGVEELPTDTPNLYVKRTYGTLNRVDGYTEITLEKYDIGVSTVTLFDQFSSSGANPCGGTVEVQVGGTNTYDRYLVDFSDASSQNPQVNINTVFRNTGGSGDNNIILSYSSPNLIAQGRKSDQRVSVKICGYGPMYPKPIS